MYKILSKMGPVTERFMFALSEAYALRKEHVDFSRILGRPDDSFWNNLPVFGIQSATVAAQLQDLQGVIAACLDPDKTRSADNPCVKIADSRRTSAAGLRILPRLTLDRGLDWGPSQVVTLTKKEVETAIAAVKNGRPAAISLLYVESLKAAVKATLIEFSRECYPVDDAKPEFDPRNFGIMVDEFIPEDIRAFLDTYFEANIDDSGRKLKAAKPAHLELESTNEASTAQVGERSTRRVRFADQVGKQQ